MQTLTLAGTVGRDAELRNTQGGDQVLNFSLAIDNGKDKSGNKREPTWFDCSLWGKRASSLAPHVRKGDKLAVTGRPSAREHNGKVYLGCNVQELTFMGGGKRDDARGYDRNDQLHERPIDHASGLPSNDMDGEIPF